VDGKSAPQGSFCRGGALDTAPFLLGAHPGFGLECAIADHWEETQSMNWLTTFVRPKIRSLVGS